MIFERNGQELTKEYFAKLATDSTNEFLGKLGLKERIEIYPQEILTDPNEAIQYFDRVRFFQPQKQEREDLKGKISKLIQRIPIRRKKRIEKKSWIDDLKENSVSVLPSLESYIRSKRPFFTPYSLHINNGVIYVPLLEGREDQWRYWIEHGLYDFVMEVTIILGTAADKKGVPYHEYEKTRLRRYLVDERYNNPRRETNSEAGGKDNWYYQGTSLPDNTFTLPSLVSMGIYKVLENLYPVTDKNVGRVVDLLAVTYSLYKSLPILSRHFTIYDFPQRWIEIYKDNMLETTTLKRWDNPPNLGEVEGLIHRIGRCVNGNLNRGLKLMGEALKKGVKDYSGMVDFLAEKSKPK